MKTYVLFVIPYGRFYLHVPDDPSSSDDDVVSMSVELRAKNFGVVNPPLPEQLEYRAQKEVLDNAFSEPGIF
ncbi:MAG: hypothetical protein ACK4TP_13800 [Hyphomicrobium sp.]